MSALAKLASTAAALAIAVSLAGCESSKPALPEPSPGDATPTPAEDAGPAPSFDAAVNCATYGGCDVQENLVNGTQTIIQLRASFVQARERAIADAQHIDVVDTVVVGDADPHVVLSQTFHR
jgi:hypothetical protein